MNNADDQSGTGRWTGLVWGIFAGLLILNVPLFLCQHLTSDAVIFDLQARCALDGGVLYRDIVEPNFPGVVWFQMLIRTLFGWSSTALRAIDLLMLSGIVLLLAAWVRQLGESLWGIRTAVLAVCVFGLYFSISEWCHCQRDTWMLLPVMAAMHLRLRQVRRIQTKPSTRQIVLAAMLEGAVWGAAFWIKPHVAIPALAVWGTSLRLTGVSGKTLYDALGLLLGGGIIGACGSAWMIQSGAWPYFWEMQLEWNPEYLHAGRSKMSLQRLEFLCRWFSPWFSVHLTAILTVIASIPFLLRSSSGTASNPQSSGDFAGATDTEGRRLLLAALYLGWMVQVLTLQHPFAYVHVPGIILAIALTGTWTLPAECRRVGWTALTACGLIAMTTSPAAQPQRLSAWWACVSQGPTPAVRSQIQLERKPDWQNIQPVLEFLRTQDLKDGELTAYTGGLIHLYSELGLRPPTRYVYLDVLARLFKSRTGQMQQAIDQSPQRFVVSSLREAGMPTRSIDDPIDPATGLPESFPRERLTMFPFTQPVVFRSGEYLVHKVVAPTGTLCTEYLPLANATKHPPQRDEG